MEACVSAVPTYEEVVRLMKVEFTEKATGNLITTLTNIMTYDVLWENVH